VKVLSVGYSTYPQFGSCGIADKAAKRPNGKAFLDEE
jgi:hypothetical protein